MKLVRHIVSTPYLTVLPASISKRFIRRIAYRPHPSLLIRSLLIPAILCQMIVPITSAHSREHKPPERIRIKRPAYHLIASSKGQTVVTQEVSLEAAIVRHAPTLNSGRIEGSLRQLTGEDTTLNGNLVITSALLVPGTPQVQLNGNPQLGGTVQGTGSAEPSGYRIRINGNVRIGRLVTRTDPIPMPGVDPPPSSTGTRDVVLNNSGQNPGNFATIRDLTLNGNVGNIAVPAGTYRNFTANGNNGFILGIAGSVQPSVYNLNKITLNGGSRIGAVGPVILTLGNSIILNGQTGSSTNPLWLTLRVASGGVTLNGGGSLYAVVQAPSGQVTLNGNTLLQGSVVCDRLVINGNSTLKAAAGVLDSINPISAAQGQMLNITLRGHNTHWTAGHTRASFGDEVSVGGAAAGELGPVVVIDQNTAIAQVSVMGTAALAPRTVRVATSTPSFDEDETDLLVNGFSVISGSPLGDSSATVSTLAGIGGAAGFSDGGPLQARFKDLASIAIGPDDSVYVADAGNNRIRRVTAEGNVSTLAGDGAAGFADGPAASARFNNPQGVAVDASGLVYVADTGNNRIRRINADGTVATVAGEGMAGFRDGAGNQAQFNAPRSIAIDNQNIIYVADTGNVAVRSISTNEAVATVAGDGTAGSADSPNARFDGLSGVAVDGATLYIYIADTNNHRIRRLSPNGSVITIAGAERGFADGSANSARFADPVGIAIDDSGKIIVADSTNSIIRIVDPAQAVNEEPQAVTTVAGIGQRGLVNGTGNQARFFTPRGVAVAASSAIIVADAGNHVLRKILLPPAIFSITPSQARVQETVVISGKRFDGRSPARNIARFTRSAQAGGGQTQAQVISATRTQLTVVVPSDAAAGPVTVQTEGGTAASPANFEVLAPAPVITDFNPKSGRADTLVTITGANLKAGTSPTSVTFSGRSGTRAPAQVTFTSPTEVRALVPSAAVTGPIELTNPLGRAVTSIAFSVEQEEGYQLTITPSFASAVQRTSATYVVFVTSSQANFSQLVTLSAMGLPTGARATFDPPQITAGASSTLNVSLADADLSPGSYSFTIRGVGLVEGRELARMASATLNVVAAGQTTLSGRVLSVDEDPIMGATVSLDGKTATTDAAGMFLLVGVNAGAGRALMIDGRTASAPNRTYPVITEPATIAAGQANIVPFIFYLPPIDTQFEVALVPGQNTVATNPRIPGLLMTIPAGANLRNRDGSPVARVSITPLPVDRTPTPLPPDVATTLVYTSQPGGAVSDVAMPVSYPNLSGAAPGTRAPLYAFNHDTVEWYIYGYGRVSGNAETIEPEIDPSTGKPYGLRDFSWHFPNVSPDGNPGDPDSCPSNRGSSPVDFSTGMKIETATDISFGGERGGLELTRIYTTDLAQSCDNCPFGRGAKHNYSYRVTRSEVNCGTLPASNLSANNFVTAADGAPIGPPPCFETIYRVVSPEQATGRLFRYSGRTEGNTRIFTTQWTASQVGDELRVSGESVEYRKPNGDVMRFDGNGRLIALADRNGNATTLNYAGPNLIRITDAVGRSITLDYDGAGRITRATDPIGRIWQYSYESGPLIAVTDPLGNITRYEYALGGRLQAITDSRGNKIKQIAYDDRGRVREQRFADGGLERYTYTMSGGTVTGVTIVDPLGRTTSKRFNPRGYVIEETDQLGQSSKIERSPTTNLPLTTSGPCGCVEAARDYDGRGNVTSITNRLGQTDRYEYHAAFNKPTRITDKLGRVTTFGYDSRGNLTTLTNALNQTTVYEHDQFGQVTSVTDPLGHATRIEYDANGNIRARTDALGNKTAFEYDQIGQLTAVTDPLGRRATITYDAMDRVITRTDESGATSHFGYDQNGNQTSVTDALGRIWTSAYDLKNRLTSATDPLNRETRLEYNANDEQTALISPSGRTTRYGYDARGQIVTIVDPLNDTVRFAYDSVGNLLTLTDERGNTTTFAYDELNRQTSRRDPLNRATSYAYDAAGNLIETIDRLGRRTTRAYDAANRLARIVYTDATVTITYDAAGRRTRIDDTQSGRIEWAYDDANRLLSETTPVGTVSYSYNAANQRTLMTAADRAAVNYSYDSAGRLLAISQGSEVFTYAYDALSRRASLARPNGVTTSHSYDEAGRLTRIFHRNTQGQAIEDFNYTYNLNNEIEMISSLTPHRLMPAAKTASTASAANRIAEFGSTTFGHDFEGQTITKADDQSTNTYEWDARGRLKKVTLPDNRIISYSYDALGRRASRAANGLTTNFLYDGDDVVIDKSSDGSATDYLNGSRIDEKLRQTDGGAGTFYFIQDRLQSTAALADSNGSVIERFQYEAYGDSAASALTRYGYTGRERDTATGLIYYRARWYDQQQGRFISEDPIGFEGGINLYNYVSNNPVSSIDPWGLYDSESFAVSVSNSTVVNCKPFRKTELTYDELNEILRKKPILTTPRPPELSDFRYRQEASERAFESWKALFNILKPQKVKNPVPQNQRRIEIYMKLDN